MAQMELAFLEWYRNIIRSESESKDLFTFLRRCIFSDVWVLVESPHWSPFLCEICWTFALHLFKVNTYNLPKQNQNPYLRFLPGTKFILPCTWNYFAPLPHRYLSSAKHVLHYNNCRLNVSETNAFQKTCLNTLHSAWNVSERVTASRMSRLDVDGSGSGSKKHR